MGGSGKSKDGAMSLQPLAASRHDAADYREATALGQSEFGGNEFLIRSGGEFVEGRNCVICGR